MDQIKCLNRAVIPREKRETSLKLHTHPNQKLLPLEQNRCNEKPSPVDKLEVLCIILNLYRERKSTFLEPTSC